MPHSPLEFHSLRLLVTTAHMQSFLKEQARGHETIMMPVGDELLQEIVQFLSNMTGDQIWDTTQKQKPVPERLSQSDVTVAILHDDRLKKPLFLLGSAHDIEAIMEEKAHMVVQDGSVTSVVVSVGRGPGMQRFGIDIYGHEITAMRRSTMSQMISDSVEVGSIQPNQIQNSEVTFGILLVNKAFQGANGDAIGSVNCRVS